MSSCFCRAHSFRLSEYNRKLTTQGKHWECWEMHILYCSQPATVITDWTEENQEGTLCRPDKQASENSELMWTSARRLCPSPGPRAPRYYLSPLKSGCVFRQQCQNKRRSATSKVETLVERSKCQLQSCSFTQTGAGLWSSRLAVCLQASRGVFTTWLLLEND